MERVGEKMDISFKTDEGRFNYRVCGIIIHENKILTMHDEKSPYYYLPGGRVQLHEIVEDAIKRELKEELYIDSQIIRPLWFNQGYFEEDVTKEKFHEICIYFLIDISNTDLLSRGNMFTLYENGKKHLYEWLTFEQLEKEYFYPIFLKKKIFDLPKEFTILKNCE